MCIKEIESQKENGLINFLLKNKKRIIVIFISILVIFCLTGLMFFLKKHTQPIFGKEITETFKNNLLFIISLLGGVAISFLYVIVGKHVKAANDFFLFFPAAIVLYQSYTLPEGDFVSNILKAINIETLAVFKSFILLCTFAKFCISICEFSMELRSSLKIKSKEVEEVE
ncbi:hypothetical protein, partial [Pantoea sp. CFSAN033090]|uniref:hypothetical protein n=1 Tax=Pantoea sp. CFSAN033090 TaxID=1690502 RepID=UPI00068E3E1F